MLKTMTVQSILPVVIYTLPLLLPLLFAQSHFYRLDALDDNAYAAFQASRNLRDVVDRVMENKAGGVPGMKKKLSVKASLMTPVLPMLVSEA